MLPDDTKLRRVAAYCRVSTDKDDQANSLENQKRYFSEYINRNPCWELAQIYTDEGTSGTSTKKRRAFNQMMSDAQNNAFDLIITKEISRFARNTLDSIYYTRKLKDLGIGVIFMNDNINTLDADAELRLTIMSSIAQEESRKTSDRVKWGQKRRMEQGVVFGRDMLGYNVRDGKLYINEKGAVTVRLIFHKFVNENKSSHVIARELREAGIQTAAYMKQWSNTAILRILRNEKYCGDLVQKKTYTPNYLTHEKKYNRGNEEYVILHNHHEPIINCELFERAQIELTRRSCDEQKAKHSNRYCFSGKIKCGICGSSFVSRSKKRNDNSIYKSWRCFEATKNGAPRIDKAGNQVGCSCLSLSDEEAKRILQETVKSLQIDKKKVVDHLTKIIYQVIDCDPPEKPAANKKEIAEKKQRLLDLYLSGDISKADFQRMNAKFVELPAPKPQAHPQEQFADITPVLQGLVNGGEWDDTFYRHILDKLTVYADHRIEVHLALTHATWRFEQVTGGCRHYETSLPISVSNPFSSA